MEDTVPLSGLVAAIWAIAFLSKGSTAARMSGSIECRATTGSN